MIRLVTYTDHRMTKSAENLARSALKMGVHHADTYGPSDLPEEWVRKMTPVIKEDRGAGFYCWKPWAVNETMKDMQDGDYLIWCDAGTELIQPVRLLIEAMDEDILFFSNGWRHLDWCKMDLIKFCFPSYGMPGIMGDQTTAMLNNAKQVQASHVVFKVGEHSRRLVTDWLYLAEKQHLVDNSQSAHDNVPTFQEHRWDQSILCCLQIMYGYKLHWFPSTTGFHIKDQNPGDNYPAMFLHHRKRNDEWKS